MCDPWSLSFTHFVNQFTNPSIQSAHSPRRGSMLQTLAVSEVLLVSDVCHSHSPFLRHSCCSFALLKSTTCFRTNLTLSLFFDGIGWISRDETRQDRCDTEQYPTWELVLSGVCSNDSFLASSRFVNKYSGRRHTCAIL